MKRIQINANPVFANGFKETNNASFFEVLLAILKDTFKGMDIKIEQEEEYNCLYEMNDEANPLPCGELQKFIFEQFELDDGKAIVSVYNYKPSFFMGFTHTKNAGDDYMKNIAEINQLKQKLQSDIVGQDHAIDTIINALIKANTFKNNNDNKPFLTALFAGPSGSGKTFLAEEVIKGLNMPYLSFSASDYFADRSIDKLMSFAIEHPRGAIIFNDFENFSPMFSSVVLNAYFTGGVYGLSFKGLTIIFTTTGGRSIYEENSSFSFANLSNDEIIESLRKEEDEKTHGPAFDGLLLNILKNENVVMFNHLDSFSIQLLISNYLQNYLHKFEENTNIAVKADFFEFARFILFSNSDETDVKSLKKKVEDLVNEQISFLAGQLDSDGKSPLIESVRKINLSIDLESAEDAVKKLFEDRDLEALFIAKKSDYALFDKIKVPHLNFNYAENVDQLKEAIDKGVDFIMLDPTIGNRNRGKANPVDIEDYNSVGMDIFNYIVRYRNSTPLYLLSNLESGHPYSSYHTLILRGAEDVISYSKEDYKRLEQMLQVSAVNYELGYDMEYLRKEHLSLESNPVQTVSNDENNIKSLDVNYRKLKLRSSGIASFDVEEMEQKDINNFGDIVGNSIPKEVLLKYGRYLSNTQDYLASGLLPPRLILVNGYTQIGKTAIIKAFANEVHAKLVKLDCKKLLTTATSLEDFYSRIRAAFNNARRSSPCVLHIDNVEMLFPAQYNDIIDKCLTMLKEELEYTSKDIYHPVLVVAESNAQAELHPKLMEMVTRSIYLEIPTMEEIEEYITRYFAKRNINTISKRVIRNFAKRNMFSVYSEIRRILEFAINYAQGKPLNDKILSESLDVYSQGDSSVRAPNDDYLYSTAYHEMGHYLLMRLSGTKPLFVTIVPRGAYGGYTLNDYDEHQMCITKQQFLDEICVDFGGRVGEILSVGEEKGTNTGISGDIRNATTRARRMIMRYAMGNKTLSAFYDFELDANSQIIYEQINEILKEQFDRAMRLLTLNRKNLDKLAKALLEQKSIIGDELEELVPDSDLLYE